MRVGLGYDAHRLVDGRPLILGGVVIPFDKGLLGHSDADVLVHAVMDSLLGAAGLPDIGYYFPSSDAQYKDISSLKLLTEVATLIKKENYTIGNIDCVIAAQEPKLLPFIGLMRQQLATVLNINLEQINIKATTTEGMGFVGHLEGIEAQVICLLQ
jgi:2-C-methyl-D-erythritol 2,4-cyclodiphosphate synthase